MPKFDVTYEASASATVTVEADTPEAAIEAGYEELPGNICAQCSGWGQKWSLDLGDFEVLIIDGKPSVEPET